MNNPFAVTSPEILSASDMARLFVPLSQTFHVDGPTHTFIHGHRGCGKSMTLRRLAPDCKTKELNCSIDNLPYLALYATVKSTDLDAIEFARIAEQHAGLVLAEHSLCLFVASKALQSLRDHTGTSLNDAVTQVTIRDIVNKHVVELFRRKGVRLPMLPNLANALLSGIEAIDTAYTDTIEFLRSLSLRTEYLQFEGAVVGYRDFLFPLLLALRDRLLVSTGRPLFVILDDADNLNLLQTKVLNTWVSYRTHDRIAFKISTQMAYKTYLTTTSQRIQSPHDFTSINISSFFTGSRATSDYPKWVADIVEKRLAGIGLTTSARDFFAVDATQEKSINDIAQTYRDQWKDSGTGYRANDDAYRYARPDFIKSLGGTAKKSHSYSYSGFDQLVHLSSGIIRYFLDDAAAMYAVEFNRLISQGNTDNVVIHQIPPAVQNTIARDSSDYLLIEELEQLHADVGLVGRDAGETFDRKQYRMLRNLINSLGGVFYEILISDRSERRVFSIALSDEPPDEIMSVLKLGVIHGYLYEGYIGSKDGRSRTKRFVLTRRLAPAFKLDPTGFSGYLFVTTAFLSQAIANPATTVRDFRENRLGSAANAEQLAEQLGLDI